MLIKSFRISISLVLTAMGELTFISGVWEESFSSARLTEVSSVYICLDQKMWSNLCKVLTQGLSFQHFAVTTTGCYELIVICLDCDSEQQRHLLQRGSL